MRNENGCYVFESNNGKPEVRLSEVQSSALLDCPFCGVLPDIELWHGGAPTKHFVGCDNGECPVTPQCTGETLQDALDNWNTRAI